MTGNANKGIIVSRSREAKRIGIKMGEPYFLVSKNHPEAICIPVHHNRYAEISENVMNIIKTFSPDVEEVSIDEAYVDLTGLNKVYKTSYTEIISNIRKTILEKLQIPVSIGLSSSKTLAKLASDKAKNCGGIFVIRPDKIIETIGNVNIEDVCGIGQQSSKTLKFNGIFTVSDFLSKDNAWIKKVMGINGLNLKFELSGIASSDVVSIPQAPQSIQDTKSFEDFTNNFEFLYSQLKYHIHCASKKLRKWNGFCGEIGIMLRTKDFNITEKYSRLPNYTNSERTLRNIANSLLYEIYNPHSLYRSIGVELKRISYGNDVQQSLFETLQKDDDNLSRILDNLEEKFGKDIVKLGL